MSMPPSKYVSVSCSLFHVPILANLFAEGEVDGQNSGVGGDQTRHNRDALDLASSWAMA
jgi:hypothetical protein